MADTDKLRPEVAAAVLSIDMDGVHYIDGYAPEKEWPMVRAELLRLTGENARLLAANRGAMHYFEQMKAEIAALKARMDK